MAIVPPNPLSYTAAQQTASNTAATNLIASFNVIPVPDISPEVANSLKPIGNIRYPYVERTINLHTVNFPALVPTFMPRADAVANLNTFNFIQTIRTQLGMLIEKLTEISLITENNAYAYMREAYEIAKRAEAAGNIPGIHSVITDLEPLFAQEESDDSATPPPPIG